MCRFSDAGNDDLATRSGGRRPKSAKARNRIGRRYTGGAAGGRCRKRLWGFGPGTLRRSASVNRLEQRCNLYVPARILLNGDFTLCPISDRQEQPFGRLLDCILKDENGEQHMRK